MKRILIPIKNFSLESEKCFIEKKYAQGFELKKRGLFFYYFDTTIPRQITCEIELMDKKFCDSQMDDWSVAAIKKTRYKKLYKAYYISDNTNARFSKESALELNYYEYYQQFFMILSICTMVPFLLSWCFLISNVRVPNMIIFLSVILIIPFVYLIRSVNVCEKKVCEMSASQGKLTGFEAHYILTFKNVMVPQNDDLINVLSDFGSIKKINDFNFKIQSPLKKEDLYKEISGMLEIEESNMEIMHVGDLSVMM